MPERSKLSDLSSRFHLLHLLVAHCCNCEWQFTGESLESFQMSVLKPKPKVITLAKQNKRKQSCANQSSSRCTDQALRTGIHMQ